MSKYIAAGALAVAALAVLLYMSNWNQPPLRVSGFIEADEIRLGSRIGGRVQQVLVQEGEQVDEGQLLVELEPFDLLERAQEAAENLALREAELQKLLAGFRDEEKAQAKARYEQFQARLDLLKAGPREQEIKAAESRIDLAEAELRRAENNYRRVFELARENAVSQQEVDDAREALKSSEALLEVRRQEYDLLKAGTREQEIREAAARVEESRQAWMLTEQGYRPEEINSAKAARAAAQAALDAINRTKDELRIKSPIDGTIEALDLQPGDMVAAGAPVLAMLDRDELWIRAYVPQSLVAVKVGTPVRVTVDSYPGKSFTGEVSFVSRQAEFTPSNVQTPEERSKQVFRIKVVVEDSNDLLRPGMTSDIWFDQLENAP